MEKVKEFFSYAWPCMLFYGSLGLVLSLTFLSVGVEILLCAILFGVCLFIGVLSGFFIWLECIWW